MGHIKMMAAAQPFLSGAISKTVNLPQDCTVQDIADAYIESWKAGIKAVAIYRDNSKGTQPLNVSAQTDDNRKGTKAVIEKAAAASSAVAAIANAALTASASKGTAEEAATREYLGKVIAEKEAALANSVALEAQLQAITAAALQNADAADSKAPPRAVRHRLPAERASVTHKFNVGGHEGYITVGLYPNSSPGEIFIRMAKEGSTVSGLMDSFATAVSLALQHGVPLRVLCEKFAHTRFEPSGWTGNSEIGYAKSIMDYIFRWIQLRFLSGTQLDLFSGLGPQVPVQGMVTSPMQAVILSEVEGPAVGPTTDPYEYSDRSAPQGGIAPDLAARSGLATPLSMEDRGLVGAPGPYSSSAVYHPADAMKDLYDMGDSPSCATCGAIMTRSGSCYRCMSCGSTSGCS